MLMKNEINIEKLKDAYFDYLFHESMIPYDEVCWLFDNLNEDAKATLCDWYKENHVDSSNTENI